MLSSQDSFLESVKNKEDSVSPITKLQLILEKKGEDRSFDELLIVRSQTMQIPCLRSSMQSMRPTQIDELCRSMELEYYSAGTTVFKQGDVGDKFYGNILFYAILISFEMFNIKICLSQVFIAWPY